MTIKVSKIRMSGNFGMGPEIVRDPRAFLTQKKTLERVITFALSFIAFCCIVSIVDVPGGCIFSRVSTCGFVKFVTLLGWLNCKSVAWTVRSNCFRYCFHNTRLAFPITKWLVGHHSKKTRGRHVRDDILCNLVLFLLLLVLRLCRWLAENVQRPKHRWRPAWFRRW